METKKILTRNNTLTDEFSATVIKLYKGIKLAYNEVYYLDNVVDEETDIVNKDLVERHYTKTQMERNMKALKNAYHIAMGAASPEEIKEFRQKYDIPASVFSIILGFSKNTISIIEAEGITSLTTGQLIKICLENKNVICNYVQLCDGIDQTKKEEISKRLMAVNV